MNTDADRSCKGKRRYATRAEAKLAKKATKRKNHRRGYDDNGHDLRAYSCPYCIGWHIGHRSLDDQEGAA